MNRVYCPGRGKLKYHTTTQAAEGEQPVEVPGLGIQYRLARGGVSDAPRPAEAVKHCMGSARGYAVKRAAVVRSPCKSNAIEVAAIRVLNQS